MKPDSSVIQPAGQSLCWLNFQAGGMDSNKSKLHLWRNQSIKHLGNACYPSFRSSVMKRAEALSVSSLKCSRDVYYLESGIRTWLRSGLEELPGMGYLGDVFCSVNTLWWVALQRYQDILCFRVWNFKTNVNVIWHFYFNAITSMFNVPDIATDSCKLLHCCNNQLPNMTYFTGIMT
jgi:hypothetical protein